MDPVTSRGVKAPTPTATAAKMQRDGRIALRLMRVIAVVRLPDAIEVADDRPTLAAGNHRSLLDIFCSAAVCANANVSCRLMVQAKYFDKRLLGRWLLRIGCIPLSGDTKDAAFAEARAALERGELVGIMPEGRLIKPEDRAPQTGVARPGVSELAVATNAVIQPIVFHHTDVAWPRNKWPRFRLRRPVVTIALGPPFELPYDDHQRNADFIMANLATTLDRLDTNTTT